MRLGYFDRESREYVITDPRTPVKWINYIGTRAFGGFVDHTGGALLCKDDPTFNRITRYLQQLPSSDFKGETLYLRLHAGGGYRIFSPWFVPGLEPLDRFECRIGLGYTRIVSECQGVRSEVTILVPPGGQCELRDVLITNLAAEALEIDVVPLVEYSHPDALLQFTNADWVPQTMQSRMVSDGDFTVLLQSPFMLRDTRVNYLTSNHPASSFETDRKRFLGDQEYGSFRAPGSLERPELGNSEARRGDNIAALLHPLGSVPAGGSRRLILQLGQAASLAEAKPEIDRYRQAQAVDGARRELRRFWDAYLEALQVDCPDPDMNDMLNLWNPYQCHVALTWSRYLSYYQTGLGARGIGYRDSMQDVLGVLASAPGEAKELILTLLRLQRRDGSAMHQFNPLTGEASQGDSLEMEDRPHFYSDDHLWGVLAVAAYLKETGDFGLLDESVPYYERDRAGRPLEQGTVLDHLRRGVGFSRGNTGSHGFPLLGFADWNDTVNLPAGAESLFSACLYGRAQLELEAIARHLGDDGAAAQHRREYEEMRQLFEDTAWDGEWYIRYLDAAGQPLGSARNPQAQIHLEVQAWAVISGLAGPERGRQAMDSVYRRLNTARGIRLSAPGYDGYDPLVGGVTTYPPGAKENGGIFLHPNGWAIIAEAMLGNGDRAHQYYAQINPLPRNDEIEIYECEPYAYAQNILGPEHPQFGLGRNSWLTGTASWCYQAGTQWILGIRPEYAGLRIDPCLPSSWAGYTCRRRFRNRMYEIRVVNPDRQSTGVAEMRIDGRTASGSLVPVDLPGDEHVVEVRLGR